MLRRAPPDRLPRRAAGQRATCDRSAPSQALPWLWLSGCGGPQSALTPAGTDAAEILTLFWWMTGAALMVWLGVTGITLYVLGRPQRQHSRRAGRLFILAGAVSPAAALGTLLALGLRPLPRLLDLGPERDISVQVTGLRWWWRVRYQVGSAPGFELANELRLPRGKRVAMSLTTADVIHALWIPSVAGKIDMIPGRINHMALEPTRLGVFRGTCAEYCGLSHARMGVDLVVLSPEGFASWAKQQRAPAAPAATPRQKQGALLFQRLGCGGCHTIRGTASDGVIGPDLTHVGSRISVGAAVTDNDVEGFRRWLTQTSRLKPGVHMPSFDMLPAPELTALASYLESLK